MAWAEPIAYGLLALKPQELESLQPYEFLLLVEGAVWRMERQEEHTAWAVSIIANASGNLKRPIKPQELLVRPSETPEKRDKATVAAELQELKTEFNK